MSANASYLLFTKRSFTIFDFKNLLNLRIISVDPSLKDGAGKNKQEVRGWATLAPNFDGATDVLQGMNPRAPRGSGAELRKRGQRRKEGT